MLSPYVAGTGQMLRLRRNMRREKLALEMRWEGAVGRGVFESIASTNSIQQYPTVFLQSQ